MESGAEKIFHKGHGRHAFIALWIPAGTREARHAVGRSPLYITGFGARVARQRCPILRAGMNNLPRTTAHIKLPAGIQQCDKRNPRTDPVAEQFAGHPFDDPRLCLFRGSVAG